MKFYRRWRNASQVICAEQDESAMAMLLATGEATTSALLGIAVARTVIPAL
jgi:hypothetical protein